MITLVPSLVTSFYTLGNLTTLHTYRQGEKGTLVLIRYLSLSVVRSSESIRAAPRGVSADWRREGNRHTLSLGEIWHLTFLAGVLLWMSVTKFQNSSPENIAVRTPEHQVETVIEAAALPQEFVPKQKCELYSGGEDAWADRRWRMISGQHFHLNNTTDRPYLHVCCRHICTWIWPIVPPSTAVCCHDVGIQFHWFLF